MSRQADKALARRAKIMRSPDLHSQDFICRHGPGRVRASAHALSDWREEGDHLMATLNVARVPATHWENTWWRESPGGRTMQVEIYASDHEPAGFKAAVALARLYAAPVTAHLTPILPAE